MNVLPARRQQLQRQLAVWTKLRLAKLKTAQAKLQANKKLWGRPVPALTPKFGRGTESIEILNKTPGGLVHVTLPEESQIALKEEVGNRELNTHLLAGEFRKAQATASNSSTKVVLDDKKRAKIREIFDQSYAAIKNVEVSGDEYVGHKASWKDAPKAAVMFKPLENGVSVDGLWRGEHPAGSGGKMVAAALRAQGMNKPSFIRMEKIMEEQPTHADLDRGRPPAETILGRTTANAADDLGAKVTKWSSGKDREGKSYIQADLEY